ncbi:MAG: hypothetical protein KF778_06810 [Rhodocyclaceae bacterium]|nr:hypothetical protein [Rhodocyclaceae bacterium]MBX3668098.1 hypothetical protein [Rhodocyclaceae bacterium]
MTRSKLTAQRLAALFLAGWMAFNYPLLSLFNLPARVLGVPLLYVYVFAAWGLLIALTAWLVERRKD